MSEFQLQNPFAFASQSMTADGNDGDKQEGMTLRDYFAAKVLQSYVKEHLELLRENKFGYTVKDMADSSYVFADAMLMKR